jgi:hypothetical protein
VTTKASLYFHINNGGVTFSVDDNGQGPELVVAASHFGHDTARTAIRIPKAELRHLAEMYALADMQTYSTDAEHGMAEMPYDPRKPRTAKVAGSSTETSRMQQCEAAAKRDSALWQAEALHKAQCDEVSRRLGGSAWQKAMEGCAVGVAAAQTGRTGHGGYSDSDPHVADCHRSVPRHAPSDCVTPSTAAAMPMVDFLPARADVVEEVLHLLRGRFQPTPDGKVPFQMVIEEVKSLLWREPTRWVSLRPHAQGCRRLQPHEVPDGCWRGDAAPQVPR